MANTTSTVLDKDHVAIDDPTQFPHGDMEELAKKAIKKFKSLS